MGAKCICSDCIWLVTHFARNKLIVRFKCSFCIVEYVLSKKKSDTAANGVRIFFVMNHKHTHATINPVTRYTETLKYSYVFFVFKSRSEGHHQAKPPRSNVMSNTETNEFMHRTTLSELNDELKGLICSFRDLEHRIAEENLSGDKVKIAFAEIHPPATLFSKDIKSFPSIYPNLRKWLNKQGAALTPHSSHRIIMTLASSIYTILKIQTRH